MHPGLLGLKNVVLAPHIGSASVETRTKMAVMAAENAVALFEGRRPPNALNPEGSEPIMYGVSGRCRTLSARHSNRVKEAAQRIFRERSPRWIFPPRWQKHLREAGPRISPANAALDLRNYRELWPSPLAKPRSRWRKA